MLHILVPALLSLFLTTSVRASTVPAWVDSVVAAAPSAEQFPEASVLILWDRRVLDIDSAGAGTMWVDQCIKLSG